MTIDKIRSVFICWSEFRMKKKICLIIEQFFFPFLWIWFWMTHVPWDHNQIESNDTRAITKLSFQLVFILKVQTRKPNSIVCFFWPKTLWTETLTENTHTLDRDNDMRKTFSPFPPLHDSGKIPPFVNPKSFRFDLVRLVFMFIYRFQ